jgi:predicted amidohydrolase
MVIDPRGVVLAELPADPGVAAARISTAALDAVRAENPSLRLRRL